MSDIMRRPGVRHAAVFVAAVVTLAGCGPRVAPPPVDQFGDAVHLSLNVSLATFQNVQSLGTGRDRYWWFDWRTDGCSSGTQEYKTRFHQACERHDFGWKNFYEIEYYHGPANTWNNSNRDDIDDQFQWDMSEICDGGYQCLLAAQIFELAVSSVPFGNICYDHYHYSNASGHIKIRNHPNSGCS